MQKLQTRDDIIQFRQGKWAQCVWRWNPQEEIIDDWIWYEEKWTVVFNIAEMLYSEWSNFFKAMFWRRWKYYKIECMTSDDPLEFLLSELNKKYF